LTAGSVLVLAAMAAPHRLIPTILFRGGDGPLNGGVETISYPLCVR